MTKEIVEAVGVLEREKGISADRLMAALEDALLSAYKKTPEAAKYARVGRRSGGSGRAWRAGAAAPGRTPRARSARAPPAGAS